LVGSGPGSLVGGFDLATVGGGGEPGGLVVWRRCCHRCCQRL